VLAFDRGGVACVANLASGPVELPQKRGLARDQWRDSCNCLRQAQ
jgi:hypothetical protein